jgi:hypothetical protein
VTLRTRLAAVMISVSLIAGTAVAAKPPVEWDGLQRVPSKRLDLVYLQPGADFRGYSKVILEPTEVSFHKNWRRDYNRSTSQLGARVSEEEIQDAISKGVAAANDIFVESWRKGGYAIADQPGPDVLRIKTAVANISVTSPDRQTSSRSYTFSNEAGSATLVIEVRDSMSGAILGRAVDQAVAGDTTVGWRTTVSNRADFRDLVQTWAEDAVRGMTALKASSPPK